MKNFILGFFIASLTLIFLFVFLLETIHIGVEKRGDIRWCVVTDEVLTEQFGEAAREIFFVTYKIFQFPIRTYYIYTNYKNEVKFYPIK